LDRIRSWWAAHRPTKRRLIQVYAALLYNAHAKGFIEGEIYTGPLKNLCVPGLNCYSCPGAAGACPLGALQNALASSGNRAPYYILGILMLFGLTLGRMICGWLCPMGLLQELLDKIPVPKLKKNCVTRALSWVKYGVLIVFVGVIPLAYSLQQYPVPAFCKYICPAGTLEGAVGLLSHPANAGSFSMLGWLFTRKFVILIAVLTACVFVYRAFCRFLCPLGAIYGLFARVSMLGVTVKDERCTRCGRCLRHCRVDIRRVGDHECIQCGECADVCPTKAIEWKGGRIRLLGNDVLAPARPEKRRRVRSVLAWIAAAALLAGVAAAVNRPSADVVPQAAVNAKTGWEPGMLSPDFTVSTYGGGGEFTLSDCAGKVVVINFWATWCTPCCEELPYFRQISEKYPEDVVVVAVHSHLVTDDVQAYLDQYDYPMIFAQDADGSVIQAFNGSTMLPMTVIVGRDGVITYNQVGSVNFETLESRIAPLL